MKGLFEGGGQARFAELADMASGDPAVGRDEHSDRQADKAIENGNGSVGV